MAKRTPDKATPARVLALELTGELRRRDAYLRELVDTQRKNCTLAPEEFAFAQVLAFGVAMCRGTLDEFIDRNLASPRDVKANVRDALRISAFEMLFLDKAQHVVVNQGVELVRHVTPRAAGLANAVLRKMARDAEGFPWGDVQSDDAAFARSFGMPSWLAVRLVDEYGRERAEEILRASLEPAPTYLHENPFMPGEQFAADASAVRVAALVPLSGADALQDEDFEILEIGAGRGTKTLLIESRAQLILGHTVPIHAVDLHEYRVHLLEERMRQNGIDCVCAYAGDARDLDAIAGLPEHFSAVLVDAPCSGTGTLRRHPEIRWRLSPEDVDELASLQLELLSAAAARVAPGGRLVYATCSILCEENSRLVDAFLASEAGAGFKELDGGFVTLPSSGGPDGHFAAILQRL